MQNTTRIWAAWAENAIRLYEQRADGTVERRSLPRKTKADLRYFLKFFRLNDRTLLLRSSDNRRTHVDVSDEGIQFQPVEGLPEQLASLPPYRVVPFMDGTLAGMRPDLSQLVLWQPGGSAEVCDLPEGFRIRDVDRDDENRVWICGSRPTQRLKSLEYRRALAVSDDNGASWRVRNVIHGGLKVAWQSLLSGAEMTYSTVDAVNGQIVLGAETGDYSDTSTFLFVRDARGRWRSGVLKHDVLRAVLPTEDEKLEVVSHYSQSVLIPTRGRWRYRSLVPRFRRLIQGADVRLPSDARYEILDAQSAGNGMDVMVVSVRVPGEERLVRFGEAVATLTRDGDRLIAFHGQDEAEIVTAV